MKCNCITRRFLLSSVDVVGDVERGAPIHKWEVYTRYSVPGYRLLIRPEHAWPLFLLILFPTTNLYRRVINPTLSINNRTYINMLSKVLRNTTPSLRALRQVTPVAKAFSSSPIAKAQGEITREPIETPLSLWNFTEEEDMIRQTGQLLSSLCLDQADE